MEQLKQSAGDQLPASGDGNVLEKRPIIRPDTELLEDLNNLFEEDFRERFVNPEKRAHVTLPDGIDEEKLNAGGEERKAISFAHKRVQSWEHVLTVLRDKLNQSDRPVELDATGVLHTNGTVYGNGSKKESTKEETNWFAKLLGSGKEENRREPSSGLIENVVSPETMKERIRAQTVIRAANVEKDKPSRELQHLIELAENEMQEAENDQATIEAYLQAKQLSPEQGENFLCEHRSFVEGFMEEATRRWKEGEEEQVRRGQ